MTAKLTRGQQNALRFAVAVVIAGMAMGFASSFATLYAAAEAHSWAYPALLPASVDSGILAYVLLDHLAVTLGARSRWLHVVAWALAGFTVWANAAVSPAADGPAWRVIHAAMPALWVLGVEALRFTWRALREETPERKERIPAGRWLAAPWPTALLWRRRNLLGITSWPLMLVTEDARIHCADIVAAARVRRPDLPVPLTVRRAMRSGRFPADVSEAIKRSMGYGGATVWEPALETWLASRLGLPETIAEVLSNDRREVPAAAPPAVAPAVPPEAIAAAPPEPVPATRQRPSESAVKRARRLGRKAPDDLLIEAIRELAQSGSPVTRYRVVKELPVGEPKADRLLAAWQAERPNLAAVR